MAAAGDDRRLGIYFIAVAGRNGSYESAALAGGGRGGAAPAAHLRAEVLGPLGVGEELEGIGAHLKEETHVADPRSDGEGRREEHEVAHLNDYRRVLAEDALEGLELRLLLVG